MLDSDHSSEEIYCQKDTMCFYKSVCAPHFSKYKHIKIQLGDRWVFSVAPQDYMVDETVNGE